ncbi:MAG: hypothetical protein KME32_10950 [Mojavia pulchra JT2-VF2]|jgi:hypothetical protein|uniref:Uncharacterized protein n=1 Tax=Mojavia pulchra JT2-VF2 TaxID=287848 RepID=A0A951PY45_9NOST|nr:hypothetical protein [Mojavia pulchra JT2-VF2]
MKKLKRDIQGKFTLKNDEYREVRSLRLTDDTWKRLGIVSECLGLTRADYLEEIIKEQSYPCNTRRDQDDIQFLTSAELEPQPSITRRNSEVFAPIRPENELQPSITRQSEFHQTSDSAIAYGGAQPIAKQSVKLPVAELKILRDHVLSELKLRKQAPGYKTAQKALNRFISELIDSV